MYEISLLWTVLIGIVALVIGALVGGSIARRRLAASSSPQSLARPTLDSEIRPEESVNYKSRAAVVINPLKSEGHGLRATVEAVCRQEGWAAPLWLETTADDPGSGQTQQAIDQGVDVVIAAGGDGTVRTVAEQLAGTDIPLGILPLGTGNLLARNLDFTLTRNEWAIRVALWGRDRRIDVARAQMAPDLDESHVFLVIAGLGFDAAVMAGTSSDLKKKVGWWAYLDAGMRNLSGKRARVELQIDDEPPFRRRVRTVLGGNCGKLPGGIELMPDAKIDDGLLDVMSVAPRGIVGWFGVAARVLGRQRRGLPIVEHFQGRSVHIQSEETLEVQLDGDPIGSTHNLTMFIDEGALLVRVPTPEQQRQMRPQMWPALNS
ncbi:diacylglycerol kinase family protein [Saxibacter everestensis]|uniref:Diacylglycerol kinase family protein n=1 Tax=Saxibacter everestensis TaxID=2909229 RepID=A0ABY8QQF4_9MICO|nr:diacylglycerol kinase family protein [Brevibacteriaceae bacterium ZFBP1038]